MLICVHIVEENKVQLAMVVQVVRSVGGIKFAGYSILYCDVPLGL